MGILRLLRHPGGDTAPASGILPSGTTLLRVNQTSVIVALGVIFASITARLVYYIWWRGAVGGRPIRFGQPTKQDDNATIVRWGDAEPSSRVQGTSRVEGGEVASTGAGGAGGAGDLGGVSAGVPGEAAPPAGGRESLER